MSWLCKGWAPTPSCSQAPRAAARRRAPPPRECMRRGCCTAAACYMKAGQCGWPVHSARRETGLALRGGEAPPPRRSAANCGQCALTVLARPFRRLWDQLQAAARRFCRLGGDVSRLAAAARRRRHGTAAAEPRRPALPATRAGRSPPASSPGMHAFIAGPPAAEAAAKPGGAASGSCRRGGDLCGAWALLGWQQAGAGSSQQQGRLQDGPGSSRRTGCRLAIRHSAQG